MGPLDRDEADRIRRAADREPAAFEALVARYEKALLGWLYRRLNGDTQAALDVSQMVWLRLWKGSLKGYDPERQPFFDWLLWQARSCLSGHIRTIRRSPALPLEFDLPAAAPDEPDLDVTEEVQAVLDRLSPEDRQLVHLRFLEGGGQSYENVAAALGISLSTAWQRLDKIVHRLRECLVGRDR
jgi:RNA polymerase sigma factor (sigma-70 family)